MSRVCPTIEGRKENRNPDRRQVLLSSVEEPLSTEWASAENVSSHGLRVLTERPWKPATRVVVKSPQGELLALARVVYCETLRTTKFALGLELLVLAGTWTLQ